MPLVLTSCTNRKRVPAPRALTACAVKAGALDTVAADWTERIAGADLAVAASELYCGRAFREAEAAAAIAGGRLMVVSAGLGLVAADTCVPSYSLTVVPGAGDNILERIAGRPSAADWWQALGRRSAFGVSLVECIKSSRGLVLMALSAQYLNMVAADLLAVSEKAQRRFRIFCLSPRSALPEGLRGYVMPYDARFDGAGSPVPGTRGDFAQRALIHFVEKILPARADGDLEAHAKAVNRTLSALRPPETITRTKASDAEIIALIHRHWNAVEGRSGRMLRYLRDDLGVACEQSRFRDLFNVARDERA